MSLLPATPDDEEGEDPRPDEQPRPSEEVGPLTANLTRQEFYDTMGYALMEHRRFQTKQRQFQDQMMVALADIKSAQNNPPPPPAQIDPPPPANIDHPPPAHIDPPQPAQIDPPQNEPPPQFGTPQDNLQQIDSEDDPPLTRKRVRVPVPVLVEDTFIPLPT